MNAELRPSVIAVWGRDALGRGDLEQAGRAADLLLEAYSRYPRALVLRALLAEHKGDLESALDDLQVVTIAEPANSEARAIQARLFLASDDTDRARGAARQALELVPSDPAVLSIALTVLNVDADSLEVNAAVLARVYMRLGWPELAERQARIAVSEMPERVDVRLTYAEALWRLGRLSTCETECRVVTDQAEDCVRAAVMRAHILSERGRTAEGQDLLDRVGQIDPEFEEARQLLATLEVHRLVLPELPSVKLSDDALAGLGAAVEEGPSLQSEESLDDSLGIDASSKVADLNEAASEVKEESGLHDPASLRVATRDETILQNRPTKDRAQLAKAVDNATNSPGSSEPPAEDSAATVFSIVAWARDLIQRRQWHEAQRVLSDVAGDTALNADEVDVLLVEATKHLELGPEVWKILGDHYMRTSRPQAAADAYLKATTAPDEHSE